MASDDRTRRNGINIHHPPTIEEFLTFQAAWLPIGEGFSGYAARFCDPG
jgi:hypothetical protein